MAMVQVRSLIVSVTLGTAVGLALLFVPTVRTAEACNCHQDTQCVYETCCYSPRTCMQSGRDEYRRCVALWNDQSRGWICGPGEACSGEPCDGMQ